MTLDSKQKERTKRKLTLVSTVFALLALLLRDLFVDGDILLHRCGRCCVVRHYGDVMWKGGTKGMEETKWAAVACAAHKKKKKVVVGGLCGKQSLFLFFSFAFARWGAWAAAEEEEEEEEALDGSCTEAAWRWWPFHTCRGGRSRIVYGYYAACANSLL